MAISVEYSELTGSPDYGYDGSQWTGRRSLKCAWDDAPTLISELIGVTQQSPSGEIIYFGAEQFPMMPALVAIKARVKAFMNTGALPLDSLQMDATYEHAQVDVDYATPTYDPGTPGQPSTSQTFVTEKLVASGQYLTLGPRNTYWDAAKTMAVDYQTKFVTPQPTMDYTYQRKKFPGPLPNSLVSLIQKCNVASVTCVSLDFTFPAETLLYEGVELSRETVLINNGQTAVLAWDMTQKFKYKETGWNKFLKPGSGTYQNIYDEAGAILKYISTGDFTTLRA